MDSATTAVCISDSTYTIGKSYGKILSQTVLFKLGMENNLGGN